MTAGRRVLCAIDVGRAGAPPPTGGDEAPFVGAAAEEALRAADREARQTHAELVLMHVLPFEPGAPMSPANVEESLRLRAEIGRAVSDGLYAAVAEVTGRSPEQVSVVIEEGPADRAIVEAAQRIGADLIVLGDTGAKGLRRALLGSVAAAVVREAPCSVLVARRVRAR